MTIAAPNWCESMDMPVLNQITHFFDALSVAVVACDRDLKIQYLNSSAEDLLGVSRGSVSGSVLIDIIGKDDSRIESVIRKALKYERRYTLREYEYETLGQRMMFDITITPTLEKFDSFLIFELHRTDRLQRLARETEHLERQKSYRTIIRSVAHEIKNPLGGIRGAAQLLDAELVEPSQRECTAILIHEADRLTSMLDRFMGARRAPKQEWLNIHRVLEHVAKLLLTAGGDTVTVIRDYDPSLPKILGDDEQLTQVVLNIAKNAVEAQGGAGTIGFRTRSESSFTIDRKLHRQVLLIQIWDHGPGVPEDIADHIFDPTVGANPSGSGLGLSIAQELLQRQGGLVDLDEYKGNTCFRIYLPFPDGNSVDVRTIKVDEL